FTSLLHWQRAALLDQLAQVGALDKFHRQEMSRTGGTGVVSVDDVRMVELAEDLNLAVEAAHNLGIRQEFFANEFERDDTIHLPVPGLEYLAGSPFTKAFQQQIRAKQKISAAALQELIHLKGG